MIANHSAELLRRIREGSLDPVDTAWLDQTPADQLVSELKSLRYRLVIQERRIGKKWELTLVRALRAELTFHSISEAIFVPFHIVPVYRDCLMLNFEANHLTGISRLNRLTVWPIGKPEPGLALKSGRGFKLDKTPDGWEIKTIRKRVVKLSTTFLQNRGWRFDHLQQLIPDSSIGKVL